ncbi:MAG: serpin family protein [Candidatus Spyradocola sp.]
MIRKILLFLLCLCLLAATACTNRNAAGESPAPSASPDASASAESPAPEGSSEPATSGTFDATLVSDTLMQTESFSLQLMQNLRTAYTDRNTLFSPLAFNVSMAALYAAAEGDTEEELRVLMGYQTEPADTVNTLTYLLSTVDSARFSLGDSLHLTQRVGFSESYIDNVTTPLRISTYSQDYSDQSTFQSINACAELLTDGRVSTILDSTAAADTLYLLSAFNLNGAFDLPFDPENTVTASFESPTGLVSTQMMVGDFTTGYAEDEYMQMVSLPMNDGAMELKLILPRNGGLQAFNEAFPQYADTWLAPETPSAQSVHLSLPAFTLNSGESYLEILTSMGLSTALRAQSVDFSGMLSPDLVLPTPLNDIFSVASLTVSESGINAEAGAEPVQADASEESVELTFDRPFLLAVTDTQTGVLLAMGWVNTVNEAK